MIKNALMAAAAAGLALAPVAAQAQAEAQPAKAPVVERSAKPAKKANNLVGGTGIIIGIFAAAAVITGIIIAADDSPASP